MTDKQEGWPDAASDSVDVTPDQPSGTLPTVADAPAAVYDLLTPDLQDALSLVDDAAVPMPQRANAYVGLRRLRLAVDRTLRSVTKQLTATLAAMQEEADPEHAGHRRFKAGPLTLVWKPIDPRYVINDGPSQSNPALQNALEQLHSDPATKRFIRFIPSHYEVDTRELGMAVADGDKAARQLHDEMKARRWRIEEGRSPSLEVD